MTYFVGNDLTQYLYLYSLNHDWNLHYLSEASIDNYSMVDDVLKYVKFKL